jgi:hypothetical protein
MIIHGFAESDQAVSEYLDELKRAAVQLPNGMFLSADKVVFSEGSVQKVPYETLYNAPVDSGVVGGGPGGARAGGGNYQQAGQGAQSLFSFKVEVKFRRTKDRPTANREPEQAPSPAAAATPPAPPSLAPNPAANANQPASAVGGNPQ